MIKRQIVSVIGPSQPSSNDMIYDFVVKLGKALVDNNCVIACGGMTGVMEAVCKGARESENYHFGCTIGIIPFTDKEHANEYCDIVIPTGIGMARNQIVANTGDVIIAIAGGAGTLSEIAFAWQFNKKVICYTGFGGWSEKLAGVDLDTKRKGLLVTAESLEDIIQLIRS